MITNIEIKLPPGIVGMEQAISRVLPEIAKALENDIRSAAQKELTSSIHDYKEGLKLSTFKLKASALKGGPKKFAVVSLSGWLANAVESGWGGGNMVGWLVRGKSGRSGLRGKYATIRFRHNQAGRSGMSGTVMGQPEHKLGGMNQQQAALVGRAIAKAAAKTLTANAASPSSPDQSARLSSHTAAQLGGKVLKGSGKGARAHTTSVYTGMTKRQDSAGTSYETFRRASVHVVGKWIHPGIKKHDFFAVGLKRLPKHVDMMIHRVIEGMKTE